MHRAARVATRLACAIAVAVAFVRVADAMTGTTSLCPVVMAADAKPLYLPVGVGGLTRLELSPGVPGGLGTVPVTRDEVARLCSEGFDVRPLDASVLPAALSIVRRGGRVYGNLWSAAATPNGVRTQWLRFRIETVGYAGQGEHVPIALFADTRALVATPAAIIGNGIVVGEVYLAPNGCGGVTFPAVPVANSEVEAFWRGGNALWGESCGNAALVDGHASGFLVASDTNGAVRYENVVDAAHVVTPPTIDTSTRRPPFDAANAGILVASTNFCSPCADFEIDFTQVAGGWSKLPIADVRIGKSDGLIPDVPLLAFAAQAVGTQGGVQRVVFTNAGSDMLRPTFAITADDAPHCGDPAFASTCANELALSRQSFSVDASDCAAVAAGDACTALVTFTPHGAFAVRARLDYGDDAGVAVRSVALEGFGVPSPAGADTTVAIEYFHAGLGHYFVTTLPIEEAVLDDGTIGGWQRTGEWFDAYPTGHGASAGAKPVCRYYGRPQAGLDSHFYSASIVECDAVAQRFPQAWMLESSDLFDIALPDPASGACASGRPVYRLWNASASSNHRYTTDRTVRAAMIAAGWIAEGYGGDGVAMCDASR